MNGKKVLGMIFANVHEEALDALTNMRTMGSVPFCSRYRLIDFPLSNMVEGQITKIGVVTNANFNSLMDHVGTGKPWDLSRKTDGLYLLPAAQTRDKDAVTPDQMRELVEELRKDFDYIILDCPAGIEQGFKNAIAAADRALVVTTPEVSAVRDADRIIGLLEANEIKNIRLIVNRLNVDMVKHGNMMTAEDVVEVLSIDLIGVVPYDEKIVVSTNTGTPLAGEDTLVGQSYMNICKRIMGEDVPFLNLEAKKGFFAKIGELFKG